MIHILKIQRIRGYSQGGVAGILMDSEHFYQQGRLLIHCISPQLLTVNSLVFFSSNISAVAAWQNAFLLGCRILTQSTQRPGTQNSILPNERFVIGFITCSDGTGTTGSGTAQVAFSTLWRDVLKNVSIALLEEGWCQQKLIPMSTGLSLPQRRDLSITPFTERESFAFASSTSGRAIQCPLLPFLLILNPANKSLLPLTVKRWKCCSF